MRRQLFRLINAEQRAHAAPDWLDPKSAQQQEQINAADPQLLLKLGEGNQVRLGHNGSRDASAL